MENCHTCKIKMVEKSGKTQDKVSYSYFRCNNCKEELLDMKQLEALATEYKRLKDLGFLKEFTSDSTLTEEDTLKYGKEVSKSISKRCRDLAKKSKLKEKDIKEFSKKIKSEATKKFIA